MSRAALGLLLTTLLATPTWAQTPAPDPAPDKTGYDFFNPTPASAMRSFNADRPAKGYSPITVDAGHVQYETDISNYTHSNVGGVSTRLYTVADPVLKLGLTNRVDLELQFNGYNVQNIRVPGSNARISDSRGAGDLVIRTKINLFGNEGGPALALIPYVKFPTAAANIGNGHTEGGLIAPLSIPLPWDFTLLVMPEVDILKNQNDAGHHFNYVTLVNIGHPIGPKVTVYGELYAATGTDHYTPPVYTADAAIAYAVTDTLQLDLGANFGLNKYAPNLQLYTGIAQRF